jgi:hypothetical protein
MFAVLAIAAAGTLIPSITLWMIDRRRRGSA